MASVLLAWELGAGLGHCAKLAPIAAALVESGHQVYFAARDVTTAQKVFKDIAVTHLQAPCLMGKPANVIANPRSFTHILHNTGFGSDSQLTSLVVSWRNLIELVSPDLVICEHAPSALLASRWCPVRRIVVGTGFSLPPDVAPLPDLRPWTDVGPFDLVGDERKILDQVNRLLSQDGLPTLSRLGNLYGDVDDSFLMTYPELDHHPNRPITTYRGVMPPSGGATVEWPDGQGPRIFAYLKPPPPAWQLGQLLELLSELPVRTIAYVPDEKTAGQAKKKGQLRVYTSPVEIASLAGSCDLAILNGTAGAGTHFLLAGVPLLMLPFFLEQVVFSRRVVQMGAGLMADPGSLQQIVARLWTLLQVDSYRERANQFASRYASYNAEQQQGEIMRRIEAILLQSETADGVR